jgi:DNA (cytosine-5)-methyltransferase 1
LASRSCGVISICTGIGALDIGVSAALSYLQLRHHAVGYIEQEAYAAAMLVERMADASMDRAPIWDNLRSVDHELFREAVDLVVAGIPCPSFSVAGKLRRGDDERNLWPATRELLRGVGCNYFFLENVAGIQFGDDPYLARITGDLAEDGWDAEWTHLSAKEVGAPHTSNRLFLLAAKADREPLWQQPEWYQQNKTLGWDAESLDPSNVGGPSRAFAWPTPPELPGLDARPPSWVGHTWKGYGNAVPPLQAAVAFVHLFCLLEGIK